MRDHAPHRIPESETLASAPVKRLSLICATDVKMENVEFLWDARIPRGKASDIEGKMGIGKTTVVTAIAGAVTTGRALPGQSSTPRGDAIIISLEDDSPTRSYPACERLAPT